MGFKEELYYIVHLDNVQSIIQHGILCHNLAAKFDPKSIAMDEVQARRKHLHGDVNLYFNPRNPMMYKIRYLFDTICVLGVSDAVLQLPSVRISDKNAAKNFVKLSTPEQGFKDLDFNLVYLRDWNVSDPQEKYRLKGILCAEVLVPKKIEFEMVNIAYVANAQVKEKLQSLHFNKKIIIDPDKFFQK